MTEQELALSIFRKKYEEWSDGQERNQDGYSYEKSYHEMIQDVANEVFKASLGAVPKSVNQKKTPDIIWQSRDKEDSSAL
ncbi:MAG TPA: hypothetical protein DCX01_09955 [Bacteroidetes bacterium]|mgnify:CR=1 FL=1|nr:hypothetical protein [Bacteroidota bacterium]